MKVMIDPAFPDHRKVKALSKALGVSQVQTIGHIISLWCRVMMEAPTGEIRGWSVEDIADAAKWEKDPQIFHSGMVECGFLTKKKLHGWVEHQGDILAKRERWRQWKAKSRGECPQETNARQTVDKQEFSDIRSVPFRTVPSPSVPSPSQNGGGAPAPHKPGVVLEVLDGGLQKAKAQDLDLRTKTVKASYELAKTVPGVAGEALARYVGFLESRDEFPSGQILSSVKKLVGYRLGMAITMGENLPLDRIFAYGIDAAIKKPVTSPAYVSKVCQSEYMRNRDGCPRA